MVVLFQNTKMKHVLIQILVALSASSFEVPSDYLRYEDALVQARQENKIIMMVFSGSDWCRPCIHLKEHVIEDQSFKEIKDRIVFMYLDFPYRKQNALSKEEQKHNDMLAEKYNQAGAFPHVVLIDSEEHIIGEMSYDMKAGKDVFIQNLKSHLQ